MFSFTLLKVLCVMSPLSDDFGRSEGIKEMPDFISLQLQTLLYDLLLNVFLSWPSIQRAIHIKDSDSASNFSDSYLKSGASKTELVQMVRRRGAASYYNPIKKVQVLVEHFSMSHAPRPPCRRA